MLSLIPVLFVVCLLSAVFLLISPVRKSQKIDDSNSTKIWPMTFAGLSMFVCSTGLLLAMPSGLVGWATLYSGEETKLLTGLFSEYSASLASIVVMGILCLTLLVLLLVIRRHPAVLGATRFASVNVSFAILTIYLTGLSFASKTAVSMAILTVLIVIAFRVLMFRKHCPELGLSSILKLQLGPMLVGFIIVPALVFSLGQGMLNASMTANSLAQKAAIYHGPYDPSCVTHEQAQQLMGDVELCWWSASYPDKPRPEVLMLHQAVKRGNVRAALSFLRWSENRVGKNDLGTHTQLINEIVHAVNSTVLMPEKRYSGPNATRAVEQAWNDNLTVIMNQHWQEISDNSLVSTNEYTETVTAFQKQLQQQIN